MDISTIRQVKDGTQSDQIANQNAKIQLGETKGLDTCLTCKKPVWISCFFDGTGNNFFKDGNRTRTSAETKYSNIAKLSWFAHPESKVKPRTYNFYATGVGTAFKNPFTGDVDTGEGADKGTGMGFARKGQIRLDFMLSSIEAAIKENMPKVSQVNIAVFGFSRGAAEARGFVHQLIADKYCLKGEENLYWIKDCGIVDGPKLEIYYMGILDTVASVGIGGSRMESEAPWMLAPLGLLGAAGAGAMLLNDDGGHEGWAQDLSIPKYVRKCDHYIAAHEVREKFPCDSTRVGNSVPPQVNEVLYPGMHSDVGGGYSSNYQEGRSNQLANIPLNNLYFSAYTSGVPFKSPSEVNAIAPELFEIGQDLKECFEHYIKLSNPAASGRIETGVPEHMKWYYNWRWGRTLRINAWWTPPGGVDPWMKITDQEWWEDVDEINKRLDDGKRSWFLGKANYVTGSDAEVKFAATDYLREHMKDSDRKLFDKFFDKYVHDSVAGFKNQMSDSDIGFVEKSRYTYNRFYFLGRNKDKKYIYWQYSAKPKVQEQ